MQARISHPIGKINERVINTFQQPILQFLTSASHIICVTLKQIYAIPLLSSKSTSNFMKADARSIVKIDADKNNRIAILYENCILEIRNVNQIQKLIISYESVLFSKEDVNMGFPRFYFKDDEIYILTTKKLEILSIRKIQRKVYSDILKQMHGEDNIIQSLAFSNLIKNQKVAILAFKNKISFTLLPISIAELQIKHVTQIKILTTSKFYSKAMKSKYLLREYLILIIDNTRLQVYNLISMKKLLSIEYDTQVGSQIDLNTDLLDAFLLVTIYEPNKQVKTNILYRINAHYYYMPTENYFKEGEPFFDTSLELNIKNPLHLLTGDYQPLYSSLSNYISDENAPPLKCLTLTAIYYRQIQPPSLKKNIKKRGKPVPPNTKSQKTAEIVLMLLDITKIKSFTEQIEAKQHNYVVRMQKQQWKQLHKWKESVMSYLQMDQSSTFKIEQECKKKVEENTEVSLKDSQKKVAKKEEKIQVAKKEDEVKIVKKEEPVKIKTRQKQEIKFEYSDPYCKLRVSLEDAVQKFKQKKFEEFLYEGKQCDDQEAIQAEFVKFIKQEIGDQSLCYYLDEVYQIHLQKYKETKKTQQKNPNTKKQIKGTKSHKLIKQIDFQAKGLNQESETQKQKHFMKRVVSSGDLKQSQKKIKTPKYNQSKFSFPTGSKFTSDESQNEHNERKMSEQREHNISDVDSDPNELFDEMLEAIEKSINRGFSPLEERLTKMEEKLDKYQDKHIGHLEKYSKSVEFECNYLNNIQSSIHGYCFEMMGQFSQTIQSGVQDYWQRIQDLDRRGTQERQKTIHQFGMYIDQQIRERQAIFDQNRSTIQNHLGHLRKAISSQNTQKVQVIEEKRSANQKSEYNPYYNMQDDEVQEMETQSFEQERMMSDYKNEMEAFSVLLSLLGNKSTNRKP